MTFDYLNRDDAPFDSAFWEMIDSTIKSVAQSELSGRKVLYADGPFGLGMQFVPGVETIANQSENVQVSFAKGTPLIALSDTFTIPARDIEAHRNSGIRLSLQALISKVITICAKEDNLLFYGDRSIGTDGLLTAQAVQRIKIKPWDQVGDAVDSIISAVEVLDRAGFHGPYTLALSSTLYNKLFRRYPQTEIIEMDHLKSVVTDGIIKASAIVSGGVLLASGKEFASIILGQDLVAGFEGPSQRDYVFTISETIALRLVVPQSICVLDQS